MRTLAVHGDEVFAGSYDSGVFRNEDNGGTWMNVGLFNQQVTAIAMCGGKIFAASGIGVYVRDDNGDRWNKVGAAVQHACSVASSDGFVYIGTNDGKVFCSIDCGAPWFEKSKGLPLTGMGALTVHNRTIFAGTDSKSVYGVPFAPPR